MTKLPYTHSPEVIAALARPVALFDRRNAELVTGTTPAWYVIEVYSREVEAELIKRQFGIYVPECEEAAIVRGRAVNRRAVLFPGYVFVFMWGTDANWGRIVNIRGVLAVIGVVSDEAIDRIRYLENCERPIVLESFEEEQVVMKKRKRRWRKSRRTVVVQDEIVITRTWSAFEDALQSLDSEGRNQALRNLFGVSS